MSKAAIYLAARKPGRFDKATIARALQHFTSSGGMVGSPALVAEVCNYALEAGWTVTLKDNGDGTITMQRSGK